jgi:hypothetical protein
MAAISATIVAGGQARIILNIEVDRNKLITTLMNLFKSFDSNLGQYMCKVAHPSGGMESLNPCRWRGKQLHHHGGGVCCLFLLLWMDS